MTIPSTLIPSPALIISLVEEILPLAYRKIVGIMQIDINKEFYQKQ